MPLEGGVDYLNPQDIQSIEVLKDAASAAIYGSRALMVLFWLRQRAGKKEKRLSIMISQSVGKILGEKCRS
ncbi:TonB-dependent receptor plug domain-containing protein [Parabacteroides distasonis]|uniref:TonB-dependent receptor plug domain-containing protein n=1 Tax=Parabacteroides distasonis TaxID=823 RepID=UPI0021C8C4A6|nr:TonB-dependent receptor plug domain-containing protein [Parabacteroides distasonis]